MRKVLRKYWSACQQVVRFPWRVGRKHGPATPPKIRRLTCESLEERRCLSIVPVGLAALDVHQGDQNRIVKLAPAFIDSQYTSQQLLYQVVIRQYSWAVLLTESGCPHAVAGLQLRPQRHRHGGD